MRVADVHPARLPCQNRFHSKDVTRSNLAAVLAEVLPPVAGPPGLPGGKAANELMSKEEEGFPVDVDPAIELRCAP